MSIEIRYMNHLLQNLLNVFRQKSRQKTATLLCWFRTTIPFNTQKRTQQMLGCRSVQPQLEEWVGPFLFVAEGMISLTWFLPGEWSCYLLRYLWIVWNLRSRDPIAGHLLRSFCWLFVPVLVWLPEELSFFISWSARFCVFSTHEPFWAVWFFCSCGR